jgi:hypothetical protein
MSQLPKSFVSELSAWRPDGKSTDNLLDLHSWLGCNGNLNLVISYSTIFWPEFILFEDYIFRKGPEVETVRGFETQSKGNKQSVEWVLNHIHITDIHFNDENVTEDKVVFVGRKLKEIWEVKLQWQFPDRPCEVEFFEPENRSDLVEFQLSFWQKKHASKIKN